MSEFGRFGSELDTGFFAMQPDDLAAEGKFAGWHLNFHHVTGHELSGIDQQPTTTVADVLNHAGSVEIIRKQNSRPMTGMPFIVPVFYF